MYIHLADQYIQRESVIHRLDPRVKVLLVLFFILSVGVLPEGNWAAFLFYFLLLAFFIKLSGVGLKIIMKRSFVALPFLLAVTTVLFTTPGAPWVQLPLVGWTVSQAGVVRFLSILLRAWQAVQIAVLLTVTTRMSDLLWSFSAMKMPTLLVATASFMYRYLFVLADEALRMIRARTARSGRLANRSKPSILWEARQTGSMVGSLFIRSLERSERVYSAMLARGYDGRMLILNRFKMGQVDWIMLFLVPIFFLITQLVFHLG